MPYNVAIAISHVSLFATKSKLPIQVHYVLYPVPLHESVRALHPTPLFRKRKQSNHSIGRRVQCVDRRPPIGSKLELGRQQFSCGSSRIVKILAVVFFFRSSSTKGDAGRPPTTEYGVLMVTT